MLYKFILAMDIILNYLLFGNVPNEQISFEETCIAFNSINGTCKALQECHILQQLLEKENTTYDNNMLNTTQCDETKVCCPNPCLTPDGIEGSCISVNSCPSLYKRLTGKVTDNNMQYVQDSRCIGPEDNSVCCPFDYPSALKKKDNCAAAMSAFPPDPRTECCGVDNVFDTKIMGGVATSIDEFPWLVLIDYVKNGAEPLPGTLCGGVLISGRYVLTAAHCVTGRIINYVSPTSVRLGEYDTAQEGHDCVVVPEGGQDCSDGTTTIAIDRIIPHPGYSAASEHKLNDIALIRLKTIAPYTAFIRPICLPRLEEEDLIDSADARFFNLTVAGWGATSNSTWSNVKQQVNLNFVDHDQCYPLYNSIGKYIDARSFFCAGGEAGKDACMGDSGGPLMYENGNVYEAIGLVSFGPNPCGRLNVPSVYTRVYKYIPWIRRTIAELK